MTLEDEANKHLEQFKSTMNDELLFFSDTERTLITRLDGTTVSKIDLPCFSWLPNGDLVGNKKTKDKHEIYSIDLSGNKTIIATASIIGPHQLEASLSPQGDFIAYVNRKQLYKKRKILGIFDGNDEFLGYLLDLKTVHIASGSVHTICAPSNTRIRWTPENKIIAFKDKTGIIKDPYGVTETTIGTIYQPIEDLFYIQLNARQSDPSLKNPTLVTVEFANSVLNYYRGTPKQLLRKCWKGSPDSISPNYQFFIESIADICHIQEFSQPQPVLIFKGNRSGWSPDSNHVLTWREKQIYTIDIRTGDTTHIPIQYLPGYVQNMGWWKK